MSDTTSSDIGHGMTVALRMAEGLPDFEDGTIVGVLLTHPCAKRDGAVVEDFIPLDTYSTGGWKLEQVDPVTMSPSVSYTCCGSHGFVREGKWVLA